MESARFTNKPQYQRPDQRNPDIDYIRYPEPLVVAQPQLQSQPAVPFPAAQPIVPGIDYGYDEILLEELFSKMGIEYITCNPLDFYGNAIPLGSFCYALAFIIYGFYRCKVYKVNDTFLWAVILLFGGIGQCTAGFLEFCKGRGFPTGLYLTYGFYCLTHYGIKTIPRWFDINQNYSMLYNYTEDSLCCFYSAMVVISFGILLASIRTNCLYIIQCLTAFVFFLLRAVGEGSGSLGTKRNAAGIFQAISGFFSLLLCFSQILNNETFYRSVFPSCPMTPYNEIDVYGNTLPGAVPGVVAPPVAPVTPVVPVAPATVPVV
jgi:succinate-acetate transporter protein